MSGIKASLLVTSVFMVTSLCLAEPAAAKTGSGYYLNHRLPRSFKPRYLSWGQFIAQGTKAKFALAGVMIKSKDARSIFWSNIKQYKVFKDIKPMASFRRKPIKFIHEAFNEIARRGAGVHADTTKAIAGNMSIKVSRKDRDRISKAYNFWNNLLELRE